jgi:hypothetical protein
MRDFASFPEIRNQFYLQRLEAEKFIHNVKKFVYNPVCICCLQISAILLIRLSIYESASDASLAPAVLETNVIDLQELMLRTVNNFKCQNFLEEICCSNPIFTA